MSKVDMGYANSKIYFSKSQSSNKNLLSDLLNEVAEAINFNMLLLREDFSEAKGYMIEEDDIPLLKEMAEVAKSSEGKRIRCKDFKVEYADTVEFFVKAFLMLASHNGVSSDTLSEIEYKMNARTDFVVLQRDVRILTDAYNADLERYFFAPTDFLPDIDDQLTKADKFIFLIFMCRHPDLDVKTMRGIYWCFVEERQSKENQEMLDVLHSMELDDKKEYLEKVKHQALFECALHEDETYIETLSEFAKIVGGGGKLQDKKKEIPLAKKLCKIMDSHADGYLTAEEYTYGEPDFKKPLSKEESIREKLEESQELLHKAVQWYHSFKAYRANHPYTPEDERMIEIMYKSRFCENMF
jgi:hypothetical protein